MKFKKPGKAVGHGLGKHQAILGKRRRHGGATEAPAPEGMVHLAGRLKARAARWAKRQAIAEAQAKAKKEGVLFDPAKVDLRTVEVPGFLRVGR